MTTECKERKPDCCKHMSLFSSRYRYSWSYTSFSNIYIQKAFCPESVNELRLKILEERLQGHRSDGRERGSKGNIKALQTDNEGSEPNNGCI